MSVLEAAQIHSSSRKASEDRVAIHRLPDGVVVVVADGAGGQSGGAAAADMAVNHVAVAIANVAFDVYDANRWSALMLALDEQIALDPVAGESTLVVAAIRASDNQIFGASVGDSGALLINREAYPRDLTTNHHRKSRLGSMRSSPVTFTHHLSGTLVVATDGLFAYAAPNVIEAHTRATEHLNDLANALVREVRLPSGTLQDDIALALVRTS